MKARFFLTLLTVMLVSSTAFAQVTLTDEASGTSLTIDGNWVLVEEEGATIAVNEEGCMMVLAVVPAAEAEATIAGLDAFLGEIIENPVVAGSEVDEAAGAFGAMGTGTVEGEAIEWLIVGGVEGEYFGMVFAGATTTAVTCTAEMGAVLEAL